MLTLQTLKSIAIKTTLIEEWVADVLCVYDKPQAELTVRFVGKKEMVRLNERYRSQPNVTNVLAFASELPAEVNSQFIGDIVICSTVIKQEAKQQQKTLEAHTAHMIVHAILHLLGFDHQCDDDAEAMENAEIKLLQSMGFTNPYT